MQGSKRMAVTLLLVLGISLLASSAQAALCVWVNPDRDIKNFFPGAKNYVTDVQGYTKAQGQAIEKRLGAKLDPDENEFKFYRVKKDGKVVGTVLTHQARGKYGAVQTVVGIGTDDKVLGVYVQRFREPVKLNNAEFLKQFVGKDANDPIAVGTDIKAIEGYDKSCAAVAYSVKKILVIYAVLGTQ